MFGPKVRHFYSFTKFCNQSNSRVLISNMTILFSNSIAKYTNQAFLVPNLKVFILYQTLQLNKFEGVDFKYDNAFFNIPAPKYPNKVFLVPNFDIFIPTRKFAIIQIRGR